MIRYPISAPELVALINAQNRTWIARAQIRTTQYVTAGEYTGGTDFWGDIKQVYITLQHEKCAYCETKLQGAVLASKVHEVEHYRPKTSVKAWPNNPGWKVGAFSKTGYYKLAYHHLNYAIACTRCNSTLKSNFFPIRGKRDVHNPDPTTMQGESALLLYPISSVDQDDPEDVITFNGVLAVPKHSAGPAYERAVTNIEFFELNHQDLTSRRAQEIIGLWVALEAAASTATSAALKKIAQRLVSSLCSPQSQFTSCASSFRRLYQENHPAASEIADLIAQSLPE